jgi:hypothetical protein
MLLHFTISPSQFDKSFIFRIEVYLVDLVFKLVDDHFNSGDLFVRVESVTFSDFVG